MPKRDAKGRFLPPANKPAKAKKAQPKFVDGSCPHCGKTALVTHIVLIWDRSGSMGVIRQEAVDAYNEQVRTIKKMAADQTIRVSLVFFSTGVDEPLFFEAPVENLKELTLADYQPDGMTAMWDAVGMTLDRLAKLPDVDSPDTAFMVTIISDGQENNSKVWSDGSNKALRNLPERIQALQATKRWTFTYLGANQDLAKVSSSLNIPLGNMGSYQATAAGMSVGSSSHSVGMVNFLSARSAGATCSADFYSGTAASIVDPSASGTTSGLVGPGGQPFANPPQVVIPTPPVLDPNAGKPADASSGDASGNSTTV
jgi:hypothetical protein